MHNGAGFCRTPDNANLWTRRYLATLWCITCRDLELGCRGLMISCRPKVESILSESGLQATEYTGHPVWGGEGERRRSERDRDSSHWISDRIARHSWRIRIKSCINIYRGKVPRIQSQVTQVHEVTFGESHLDYATEVARVSAEMVFSFLLVTTPALGLNPEKKSKIENA